MYPAYLAKWEGKPWDYPIITTAKGGGQVVHPLYQMFAIGSCLMLLGTLLILLALAFRGASDTANT